MNEQIAEYGKTFTVPKNSIYKTKMDQTLLRIVQAGLGKDWKLWKQRYFKNLSCTLLANYYLADELEKAAKALAAKTGKSSSATPLTFEQLAAPLALLFIILAICVLVFLIGK